MMTKNIFSRWEYVFTIASIVLYMRGLFDIIITEGLDSGLTDFAQIDLDNNSLASIKFLYIFTYLIAFLLLVRSIGKFSNTIGILVGNTWILSLIGLTIFSTVWSESPDLTSFSSVSLIGTTIFGVYLATCYTKREQIILLKHVFFIIIFLSVIFITFLPQSGIMGAIDEGNLRGISDRQNQFGRIMALSAIVFTIQPKQAVRTRLEDLEISSVLSRGSYSSDRSGQNISIETRTNSVFNTLCIYLGLCLSIFLLILSKSSTGIVYLAIMMVVLAILKIRQLPSDLKICVIIGLVAIFGTVRFIIDSNPELIFTTFGINFDLTGHWNLWNILFDLLSKSPIFGFGYGGFWSQYSSVVNLEAGLKIAHAHNGFLEIALSVGILGLVLFAIGYLDVFFSSFARFCHRGGDEYLYRPILLIYIAISSMSETGLFEYNNIFWPLYIMISYSENIIPQKSRPISPISIEKQQDLLIPIGEWSYPSLPSSKPMLALPPGSSDRKLILPLPKSEQKEEVD